MAKLRFVKRGENMTKSKKISPIIIVVVALLIACAVTLVACDKDKGPTQYTVTYVYNNGQENLVAKVEAGSTVVEPASPVKEGYDFVKWVKRGETEAYDFSAAVNADLTLEAVWQEKAVIPVTQDARINWRTDESAKFSYEGSTPRLVKPGTTVKFGVIVSPYYAGEPIVTVDGKAVTAGTDGNYSFVVGNVTSVTVSVSGLQRDDMKIKGIGTERNPYLVENASQLRLIADSVNAGDETYKNAHIELCADIDMKGFEIEPIGTTSYQFMGTFDGKNHTVSNYTVNSDNGLAGFFGCIANGEVKNLNLNADVEVETTESLNYIVGGVAAYCISGDVTNCSFDGSIKVINTLDPDTYIVYLGGICGFVQGYETDYTGTVTYCSVHATLSSEGDKTVYTTGGIAGATHGSSEGTPAYVHNCVFDGEISGRSIISGGIVGYLRDRSSVANCFSNGKIHAQSAEDYAAAGAIVGVADNETVVTYCASTAICEAIGADHEYETSDITGIIFADGNNTVDSRKAMTIGSYYGADGTVTDDNTTYNLNNLTDLVSLLGWDAADWKIVDGKILPDAAGEGVKKNIKVTFEFGKNVTREGNDGEDCTISTDVVSMEGYGPVYWIYDGNGMNNFVADDRTISYGYFFDSELTKRVPSALVVTQDTTIYVGFSDYSSIAGEYHTVIGDNEITLTFDDNGKMTMRDGAMIANYVYVYDGKNILIRDGYFAYFDDTYASYARQMNLINDYYAEKTSDGLIIYDNIYFTKGTALVLNTEITATARNNAMGKWYDSSKVIYTFLADGTGKTSDDRQFTYSCVSNSVTVTIGNKTVRANINADKMTGDLALTKVDDFCGTWETSFNTIQKVTFDGMGTVTYNGGESEYTVAGGVATFDGYTAGFDSDGLLEISKDGAPAVYGREGSFMGTWVETYYNYWFRLDGITKDEYGTGYDSNGINFTYSASKSEVDGKLTVTMYYRTMMYGSFDLEVSTKEEYKGMELLYLAVYTSSTGFITDNYNMCYYDPFYGEWNSSDGTSYKFNGLGTYDIYYDGIEGTWVAQGYVDVTNATGESKQVRYYYDKAECKITFEYDNVGYTAVLSDDGITIEGKIYKNPDAVYGYKYQAEGLVLEFNGKSNVGIGKATLDKNGTVTEYDYNLTETENLITATLTKDGTDVYTVTFGDDGFTMTGAGETVSLGLYHVLAGKNYAITADYTIGVDGILNNAGTGKGHFGDSETEVTVLYIDETYVALYIGSTFLYYLGYHDENNAVLLDSSNNVVAVVSIPDGMAGRYVSASGNTITLDGCSKGAKYIDPSAEMTFGGEEDVYSYTYKEEDGVYYVYEVIKLTIGKDYEKLYRISFEATEGAEKYETEDGKVIYLVPVTEEE